MPETPENDSTQRDSVALYLIARLYRAVVGRSDWHRFAAEFSEAIGGAAVTLAIRRAETRLDWDYFGAGSLDLVVRVAEELQGGLVRAARRVDGFPHGFVDLAEAFPGIDLTRHAWFQKTLVPHGVAPTWPLCHAVTVDRTILCWILVQPHPDGDFDDEHLVALGAQLAPHLVRAFSIHRDLCAQSHKQRALEEVLDRLPTGVILIDASRRVIHANLSAQRMIALGDGVSIRDDRVHAGRESDASVQDAIGAAIEAAARGEFGHVGRVMIATRSGRRPFLFVVTPLLRGVPGSRIHDAVSVAFLANPDAISTASVQALEAVYGLTTAEAAIVRGLVRGQRLEEIAAERRVKLETTRTQLKQVFAKTRTRRQAELIRLVLTGVSPLSQSSLGSIEGESP